MKIRFKFILAFLVVSLTLVSIGYMSSELSQRELQTTVGESLVSLSGQVMDQADRDIYNRMEEFQLYCTRPLLIQFVSSANQQFEKAGNIQGFVDQKDSEWVAAPQAEITPFMQGIIDNWMSNELRKFIGYYEKKYGYRVYGEVFIANKYGAVIAATGKTSDYRQDDEDWWQAAKRDGSYVSNVEYDQSSGVYSISISTRINDDNGSFIGVMKAVMNIDEAMSIIREADSQSRYPSSSIQLMEPDGRMIFDSDTKLGFLQDISGSAYFREIKAGSSYFILNGDNGATDIFAYAHSRGYKDYKGFNWILSIKYNTEDIFGSITRTRNITLFLFVSGILLAIMLGLSVHSTVSMPLDKLKKLASRISKGELDAQIDIKSKDEIGELASAFNEMEGNLKKSRKEAEHYTKDLEKQVSERTKTLEQKVWEMERFNKFSVGRELKMIELKKRIKEMEGKSKARPEKGRDDNVSK